ncbi:MAG: hypothetical protein MJE77_42625 [Proteobacteria bacterium]|nr:hypothetical protein [Pseudomonadota bacterium]
MPARVNDQVVFTSPCVGGCNTCPHPWTGIITGGSPNTTVNSIPVARKGDPGSIMCPHGGTFKITMGSGDTENSPPVARIGDSVQCNKCGAQGKIIAGSPNVFVNKF